MRIGGGSAAILDLLHHYMLINVIHGFNVVAEAVEANRGIDVSLSCIIGDLSIYSPFLLPSVSDIMQ